jgi:geranylgeranyl diphosphate synthase type I
MKKQLFDFEISKLLSSISNFKLFPLLKYSLASGGKRLRPFLLILSAQSVGGKESDVMQLALAIELIHNASLVLDDIIDNDHERRGCQALHKKWSMNDATLAAFAMSTLAIKLATKYGAEIIRFISEIALQLCEGEYFDMSSSLEAITEDEYFLTVKKKSASLFKASTRLGALVGGGSPTEVEALTAFGENFGIAYQLRDDLLELKLSRESIPRDLIDGRPNLLLIHFLSKPHNKKILEKCRLRVLTNNVNYEKLLRSLEREGSFKYCERKINYYVNQAVTSLSVLKSSSYKRYLILLAKNLVFDQST